MIETLLAILGSTTDFKPSFADQVHQSQTLIVKAAEDYALSHTHDRIHVGDLCRAAATSERSLEYAFKSMKSMKALVIPAYQMSGDLRSTGCWK